MMRPPVRQDEAVLLLPAQPFTASHVNHTCRRCRRRIQWVGGVRGAGVSESRWGLEGGARVTLGNLT